VHLEEERVFTQPISHIFMPVITRLLETLVYSSILGRRSRIFPSQEISASLYSQIRTRSFSHDQERGIPSGFETPLRTVLLKQYRFWRTGKNAEKKRD
jgi:hypothetical protein